MMQSIEHMMQLNVHLLTSFEMVLQIYSLSTVYSQQRKQTPWHIIIRDFDNSIKSKHQHIKYGEHITCSKTP